MSIAVVASPPRPTVAPGPRLRSVLTLSRVEGRRLATHPAVLVPAALAIVQSVPFILSGDATKERNVGWLLQVSASFVSFGALLAANLLASQSRRDGSEEEFRAAPMSVASRTVASVLAGAWVMATIALVLLAGDLGIRAAAKGAATDTGQALFPMFDLIQGPLLAGLFVVIGVAVARKVPKTVAGPLAIVALFVAGNYILDVEGKPAWLRLTPFGPTFLDDGGALQALHVVYLLALATIVVAVALFDSRQNPKAAAWLAGGVGVAAVSGALQLLW